MPLPLKLNEKISFKEKLDNSNDESESESESSELIQHRSDIQNLLLEDLNHDSDEDEII